MDGMARIAAHLKLIRKFSQKVIVIVDPDTTRDREKAWEIHDRLTDAGFDVFLHHCDLGDTKGYSSLLYCEFDTDEQAALFKLTYL